MYSITIDFPDSGIRKFTYSQDNGLIEITEIRRCINNYFFENQVVTISLNNQTGYWYRLFEGEDQYLIGQTVKVYDNKMHIGTFTISDITPGTIFKIKADLFSVLSGSISRELTAGEFPEIHFENIGKKGCFIFGVLDDADWLNIGQCWAYQIAPGKFLAAFHHLKNVLSVFDTKDNAIAFTWENEGDYSYIYTDFQGPEVFFNCEGCCDQQGALIQNPAKILEAMQEMSGGPAIDGLTAAEAIYINKAYLENAIIIQDETWQQFLELFCYNYDTFCYQGIPGAVKMAVQDFENAAKTKTINHSYIKDYSPDLLLDECVKAVKRRYYYHYRQKNIDSNRRSRRPRSGSRIQSRCLTWRFTGGKSVLLKGPCNTCFTGRHLLFRLTLRFRKVRVGPWN
ncbi:MAG: hypothetical protein GY765_02855 [bacterium]|nr:hypothetical protein [bacterium]